MALYAAAPWAGATGSLAFFVLIFGVILTMYGGGFATIPAYLADRFGEGNVSAIHGRLLTAWSTAGILGPVLTNYIREFQLSHGVAPANAYTFTMYILVAFLAIGLICNLLITPVRKDLFTMKPERFDIPEDELSLPPDGDDFPQPPPDAARAARAAATARPVGQWGLVAAAWLLAGVPIGLGVFKTLQLAARMFQ
jgi:hypothetical protein